MGCVCSRGKAEASDFRSFSDEFSGIHKSGLHGFDSGELRLTPARSGKGRKGACITYFISYILSCMTNHSSQFKMMLGRILEEIATCLLFSAFETWLAAEHNKG